MKIHNKLIKSTTVAEKTDLRDNFIITILSRAGLHRLDHILNVPISRQVIFPRKHGS